MSAKKTAPKKTAARKAAPKAKPKATAKAKPQTKSPNTLLSSPLFSKAAKASAGTRRPPDNPQMPKQLIAMLTQDLNSIKEVLEEYAAHLRSLDRKRLNGVGIKKQGFIERVFEFAAENPEFFPHYLTLEKFREDGEYFIGFRTVVDILMQLREIMWNITTLSSDVWYTDALEYYSSIKEAAKRRVDPAESIYNALEPFFKSRGNRKGANGPEGETKKQALRDFKALQRGTKDGKMVIENISPKMTGGVHKVIDEKFTDSAQYKETEEGELKE